MGNRKLELAFIDKDGKVYPTNEATGEDLAKGLEKISRDRKEAAIVERTKIEPSLSPFFCSCKTKHARLHALVLCASR